MTQALGWPYGVLADHHPDGCGQVAVAGDAFGAACLDVVAVFVVVGIVVTSRRDFQPFVCTNIRLGYRANMLVEVQMKDGGKPEHWLTLSSGCGRVLVEAVDVLYMVSNWVLEESFKQLFISTRRPSLPAVDHANVIAIAEANHHFGPVPHVSVDSACRVAICGFSSLSRESSAHEVEGWSDFSGEERPAPFLSGHVAVGLESIVSGAAIGIDPVKAVTRVSACEEKRSLDIHRSLGSKYSGNRKVPDLQFARGITSR